MSFPKAVLNLELSIMYYQDSRISYSYPDLNEVCSFIRNLPHQIELEIQSLNLSKLSHLNVILDQFKSISLGQLRLQLNEELLSDQNIEGVLQAIHKTQAQLICPVILAVSLLKPGSYYNFFDHNMNESTYWQGLHKILSLNEKLKIHIHSEINIFNLWHLNRFLDQVLILNLNFKNIFRDPAIYMIFDQIEHPIWQSLRLIPKSAAQELNKLVNYLEVNQWNRRDQFVGFHPENMDQVCQIIDNLKLNDSSYVKLAQNEFKKQVIEYAKIKRLSLQSYFPELVEQWNIQLGLKTEDVQDKFELTREKLNKVSPSFCLAKWTTVSLHLESGTNHSCHHPAVHPIDKSSLKNNPAKLHNTDFKIEQRKMMVNGVRPKECDYCWNIEDLRADHVSDRIIKSAEPYSLSEFDEIVKNPFSEKMTPRYLEVSFSNKCQFKCSYCSADYSSSWADEIKKFGSYSTQSGSAVYQTIEESENEYVEAFWRWWPELKTNLHTLRITGGEPLLSPNTFRLMEQLLIDRPNHLSLSINTNLGAPPVLINKFIDNIRSIEQNCAVKKLDVYTSIDAFGAQAEYIRNGLNTNYFWENIEKILSNTQDSRVYIMCTFNALSLPSFVRLLKKFREINIKYKSERRTFPLDIDFAYLRHPEYQAVKILTQDFERYFDDILQYMTENEWLKTQEKIGFLDYHLIKMKRIRDWMREGWTEQQMKVQRARFYEFFSEHDRRRNVNFLETFPEYENFWQLCKKEYDDLKIKKLEI